MRTRRLCDANTQVVKGASAVALEGDDVLSGPKDRPDPLADRGEVNAVVGLVLSRRPDNGGVELVDCRGESATRIALVTDDKSSIPTSRSSRLGEAR